jgi:hypothetical protein
MQLFAGRAGVHDLYADHGFPISARPYGAGSTAYRFADGTRYFEPSEPSTGTHLDVVAVFVPPLDAAMSAGDIYRDPLNPWSYATTIPGVSAGAGRLGKSASRAGRCAAPKGADNVADGLRLNKSLASQSQLGEAGTIMAGPGGRVPFRDAPRVAQQYGGSPSDWVKKSSSSYTARDGAKFETHWVENIQTGQRVEFKTKFPGGE